MPRLRPVRQACSVADIGRRVEPAEKANAIKPAELHFDSPESAGYGHNAPLTKITQVQYWPRGGAGGTLITVGTILRLCRGS
jgi:hypothetical protein